VALVGWGKVLSHAQISAEKRARITLKQRQAAFSEEQTSKKKLSKEAY